MKFVRFLANFWVLFVIVAMSFVFYYIGPLPQEDRSVAMFDARVSIGTSGAVRMTETISYDFGSEPGHGLTRTLPSEEEIDGYGWRDLGLTDVTASGAGDLPVEIEPDGDETRVRVGDFDGEPALTGEHQFEISYTYDRLVTEGEGGSRYYADIIGSEWEVPIERTRVRVDLPEEAFDPTASTRSPRSAMRVRSDRETTAVPPTRAPYSPTTCP